ncbi:hypothetical protein Acid345_4121 [Candidatus Koribacter versatilis Ellin345]|uniref:Uncharacterized protein n=1 Tax=Koribacter versatilis (strain Ellin345) TaxID=204669 RepID=Q1IJ29_KORVE|nr:hypothetical protein [Candidatus Koribacter versatilis]ABF43121.1 hypothetical protein Acid345_4121 [Candidatus Koribacter versatilis Ellin345]
MPLRPFIVALALTAALAAQTKPVPAPSAAEQNEAQKAAALWRDRAERLTNASIEEGWHIRPWDAVMKAHLAEAWWKDDPARAHQWLSEAYEDVTFQRKNEGDDEHIERLRVATYIFEVLNRIDTAKADQLLKFIIADSEKLGEANSLRSQALLQVILQNATTDALDNGAARAEEIAEKALQLRGNQYLPEIIGSIRYQDEAWADQFYIKALNTAVESNDYDMVFGLMQFPFPYFDSRMKASNAVRDEATSIFAQFLSHVPKDQDDNQKYCERAPNIAQHLLPQLPVSQQGLIHAAIETCQSSAEGPKHDWIDSDACTTADSCLKLAAEADSPNRSARLKELAAIRAIQDEHDPQRAVEIVRSLTDDEKSVLQNWMEDYKMYAMAAIDGMYKQQDTPGIQQIIDRAPAQLRADMLLNFVGTLSTGKKPDPDYARIMLTEARRALEGSPTQNPQTYMQLLRAYQRLFPEEAPQALGFVIAGLNQIEYLDPKAAKKSAAFRYVRLGDNLIPLPLKALLLERDESYTLAAIKTLDDPKGRIAFRLGLLNASLKRYEEELQKAKTPAKPATKQAANVH